MEYEKDKEIWEQQPGEPDRWYEIFMTHYLPLGQKRTVSAAWRSLHPEKKTGQIGGTMRKASMDWEWEKRASRYYEKQSKKFLLESNEKIKDLGNEIESSKIQRIRIAKTVLDYVEKCVILILQDKDPLDTDNISNMESISKIFDRVSDRITTDFGTNPKYFDDLIDQARQVYKISISRNSDKKEENKD